MECLFTIPRGQNAKFLQPSKGRVVLGLENQASNEPCHVSTSPGLYTHSYSPENLPIPWKMLVRKLFSLENGPFSGDMLIFRGCNSPSVELLKGSDASGNEDLVPQKKRNFESMIFNFPSRRDMDSFHGGNLFDILIAFKAVKVYSCSHPMSTVLSMVSRWHGSATQPPGTKKHHGRFVFFHKGAAFESTSSRQ